MLPIPMHLHLHKDGLLFLRDFFLAALALAFVVAVWSGAFAVPVAWLLERAAAACPPPDKTLHRAEERQQENRSWHVFKIFLVVVAVLAVADFFAPEPFHLGFDRAAPLVVGLLVAGFLIVFLGSESWDGLHRLAQVELLARHLHHRCMRDLSFASYAHQGSAEAL